LADKRPDQGSTPLEPTDKVLYKEIETGVFALTQASAPMVGTSLVSATNPLPTTQVSSSSAAITPSETVKLVNGNTELVPANANRKYLLIVNDSNVIIYISLGGNAAVGKGIRLNANGGNYEMSGAFGNLFLGVINANHGGGAVDKRVLVTGGT
jgi:hypothetical protein